MRILTYNCCALPVLSGDISARVDRIGQEASRLKPDLIFFQELFLPRHLRVIEKRLYAWPNRFFGTRTWMRHSGGLAVFSRTPLEGAQYFSFREQGSWLRYSALARFSGKGFMAAKVRAPNGAYIKFVHTHLLADYRHSKQQHDDERGDPYPRFQQRQVAELFSFCCGIDRSEPLIMAGDFNMSPYSELMWGFLRGTELRDSMEGVSTPSVIDKEKYYRVPYNPYPGKRLDYVLYRDGGGWSVAARDPHYVFERPFQIKDSRHVTLSDHRGILVDLEVSRNGR